MQRVNLCAGVCEAERERMRFQGTHRRLTPLRPLPPLGSTSNNVSAESMPPPITAKQRTADTLARCTPRLLGTIDRGARGECTASVHGSEGSASTAKESRGSCLRSH